MGSGSLQVLILNSMIWKRKWWNHFQVSSLVDWVCEGFSWNEETKKTNVLAQTPIKYRNSLAADLVLMIVEARQFVDRGACRCSLLVSSPSSWLKCCLASPSSHSRESESESLSLCKWHYSHHGTPPPSWPPLNLITPGGPQNNATHIEG